MKRATTIQSNSYDDYHARNRAHWKATTSRIEKRLRSAFRQFENLDADIYVGWPTKRDEHWAVRNCELVVVIVCNPEIQHLKWSWCAGIKPNDDVIVSSAEWDKLSIKTADDANILQESIQAIQYLESQDWEELLAVEVPLTPSTWAERNSHSRDRVSDFGKFKRDPDIDKIEDYVGKKVLIKGTSFGVGYPRETYGYYLLISKERRMIEVAFIPKHKLPGIDNLSKKEIKQVVADQPTFKIMGYDLNKHISSPLRIVKF